MSTITSHTCRCASVDATKSGTWPHQINEFTDVYTTHFSYDNWDQIRLFTCGICSTIWFIDGQFVDRPPYFSTATHISKEDLPIKLAELQEKYKS